MEELTLTGVLLTTAPTPSPTPPAAAAAAAAAGPVGIWATLEDLDAQELRLYALGWGDHLPVELLERIDALRRRKLALEAELELDVDDRG